jgi:hypothetical protein
MNIEQLRARLVELNETGKAIQAKADAEKRELTAPEQKEIDAVFASSSRSSRHQAPRAPRRAGRRASANRVRNAVLNPSAWTSAWCRTR